MFNINQKNTVVDAVFYTASGSEDKRFSVNRFVPVDTLNRLLRKWGEENVSDYKSHFFNIQGKQYASTSSGCPMLVTKSEYACN